MLVGSPAAVRKLHHVRLANDDHASADKLLRQGRGTRASTVTPRRATAARDAAFQLDQVLECNWNAVQGPDGMT
jgi:hypothetical protein